MFVSLPGLLPQLSPQLASQQAAEGSAPVFWDAGNSQLCGDLSGYSAIFAAGGKKAEVQCGNSLLEKLEALLQAAGGGKPEQTKAVAAAIEDAANMREADYFDAPERASLRQLLNSLDMRVALGSKNGPPPPAAQFAAIQF